MDCRVNNTRRCRVSQRGVGASPRRESRVASPPPVEIWMANRVDRFGSLVLEHHDLRFPADWILGAEAAGFDEEVVGTRDIFWGNFQGLRAIEIH